MNRFKNIALILITLAFLFESSDVLVTIDLCVHRFIAQEEAHDLSSSNLTRFIFTKSQFSNLKWTEGNKEFELDHKRFDVASMQQTGNSVTVLAKADEKENSLLSLMDNFHKNTHKNIQLLKSQKNYLTANSATSYQQILSSVETHYFSRSVYAEPVSVLSPPPNFC